MVFCFALTVLLMLFLVSALSFSSGSIARVQFLLYLTLPSVFIFNLAWGLPLLGYTATAFAGVSLSWAFHYLLTFLVTFGLVVVCIASALRRF